MVRWAVSFTAIVAVLTALYHFGTRRTERWFWVPPGAIAGTLIWFPATLAYGWYVTSIANYTRLYGPFAEGIATLVWLYITSFSVLLGAELNGALLGSPESKCRYHRTMSRPSFPADSRNHALLLRLFLCSLGPCLSVPASYNGDSRVPLLPLTR